MDADATIRDLVGRGVPFRDLEVIGAGLEQAFLTLTRDGPVEATVPAMPTETAPADALGRGDS
jgi:ABC-2 type transport system ATP-binding protein